MKVDKNNNNGIGSYRWTESVMGSAGIQIRTIDPGSIFTMLSVEFGCFLSTPKWHYNRKNENQCKPIENSSIVISTMNLLSNYINCIRAGLVLWCWYSSLLILTSCWMPRLDWSPYIHTRIFADIKDLITKIPSRNRCNLAEEAKINIESLFVFSRKKKRSHLIILKLSLAWIEVYGNGKSSLASNRHRSSMIYSASSSKLNWILISNP